MAHVLYAVLALFGGTLLAGMVAFNGQLYVYVSPMMSSWIAHGIGALTALLALALFFLQPKRAEKSKPKASAPWWSYLGGLPGAFVVVLAVITVNGYLGVTGTLVLSIVGQVGFGLMNDHFGWFGFPKQVISFDRMRSVVPIVLGAVIMIYAKGKM